MTEGLEAVAHLITRYATFEVLYLQTSSALATQLEDALVALYASVLIYIAKAKRYFQASTTGKFVPVKSEEDVEFHLERLVKSAFLFGEDTAFRIILAREAKVSELARLIDSGSELEQLQRVGVDLWLKYHRARQYFRRGDGNKRHFEVA